MTINVGNLDRGLRLVLGLLLILSPFTTLLPLWSSGLAAYGIQAVGLVLVGTALFRFCPLYRIFGLRSCRP